MMQRRHRVRTYVQKPEIPAVNLDDLVVRIRRLVQHRGFDRSQISSPLLRRLTPERGQFGHAPNDADLRHRLKSASLDARAVSYLTQSADAEIDLARLRLT